MTIATKNCASDIRDYLSGNTLSGLALLTGRNVFAQPPEPKPSMCIFLINDGGEIEPFMSPTPQCLCRARVRLTVYGTAGTSGFTAGEALAREALEFLHQKIPSGYVGVRSLDASPQYIGTDQTGRHQWDVSISAWYTA